MPNYITFNCFSWVIDQKEAIDRKVRQKLIKTKKEDFILKNYLPQ